MAVSIEYKASVARDLRKLGHTAAVRVLLKVERLLASEGHQGEALSGEFAGLYKLRIGDYRVIYARTEKDSSCSGSVTAKMSTENGLLRSTNELFAAKIVHLRFTGGFGATIVPLRR